MGVSDPHIAQIVAHRCLKEQTIA